MRVSNGRRVNHNSNNRRTSPSTIENRVSNGKDIINKGNIEKGTIEYNYLGSREIISDNTNINNVRNIKEDSYKHDSSNLEIEKENIEIKQTKLENKKKNLDKRKNKTTKKKENKLKSKKVVSKPIGKLSALKISGMIAVGLLSSTLISGVVYGGYYNLVRYPMDMKQDVEHSGLGCIENWLSAINSLDNSVIKANTGADSYLAKEIEYANGDEDKIAFIKKMLGTVSYIPKKVEAKNIYGNPMISRVDDSIVLTDSLVNDINEEVTLEYVDYSKIELDKDKIKEIMNELKIEVGVGDYSNNLIKVFCRYINSLESENIPLKSENHIPNMVNNGTSYSMTEDEDIILDKYLFSSDEFHDLLVRFSLEACKGIENAEWVSWSKLSDKDKEGKAEPKKTIDELQPTSAWVEWNSKSNEEKKSIEEPKKYDENMLMSTSWCGSYYLLNDYKDSSGKVKSIEAEVGDGSIENPAGLNTGVVTSVVSKKVDSSGKEVKVSLPIKVKLVDFKVSKDALNYFETKDTRNRGYDVKSGVQYASYIFEVTNLSDEVLNISDNSSLSDGLANLAPRTGTVYGLQSSVSLKPHETGIVESWGNSTELNKKYLIWGADFNREYPVVYFRVLMGNLEDTSEDKGVTLNGIKVDSEETESEKVIESTDSKE